MIANDACIRWHGAHMKHTEMAALGDYTDGLSLFLDPVPSKQNAVQTRLSPQWHHLAYKAGSRRFYPSV